MNLGRVRAATTVAAPIVWFSSRTGTATFLRCIPMSVSPMSSPASARISSSATGSSSAAYTRVASEPPAFGCGTTLTISAPGAAARSVIMARFKCSQHCTARNIPRLFVTSRSARAISSAVSTLEFVPILAPTTSLVEQPTTRMLPGFRCAFSQISAAAAAVCSYTAIFLLLYAFLMIRLFSSAFASSTPRISPAAPCTPLAGTFTADGTKPYRQPSKR